VSVNSGEVHSIANDCYVQLSIYNVNGQLIRRLVNGRKEKNEYAVTWDGKDDSGKDVSSGVYFYRLKTDYYEEAKKLILLR
jgi:flagellar hook assembly protein FlgD